MLIFKELPSKTGVLSLDMLLLRIWMKIELRQVLFKIPEIGTAKQLTEDLESSRIKAL